MPISQTELYVCLAFHEDVKALSFNLSVTTPRGSTSVAPCRWLCEHSSVKASHEPGEPHHDATVECSWDPTTTGTPRLACVIGPLLESSLPPSPLLQG